MQAVNIHYIQHEPFEDLGSIRDWRLQHPYFKVSHTHVFENEPYPTQFNFDLLIVMGGSMSAYDDDKLPWLALEKQFIKHCIENGTKVLGICLGAQLLAHVLGAKVYPGKHKEIGWFPVQNLQSGHFLFQAFPKEFTTMHWHGDTFDLPTDAIWCAKSEATAHQAFIWGNGQVVALQFHPEMTQQAIEGMIDETGELIPAKYIHSIEQIRGDYARCQANNSWLATMLNAWLKLG